MVEVFDVMIQSLLTTSFIRLYKFFLISSLSTTASIIKSQSASLLKSSSIFPILISSAFVLCIRAGGSDLISFFTAFSVMLFGVSPCISRRRTSWSELAI